MIPKVRTWRIRVLRSEWPHKADVFEVYAPTRRLAILAFRQDHPEHWGRRLFVSVKRGA